MKEFVLDVVVQKTYSRTICADTLEQAEDIARNYWKLGCLDAIDEGIVAIDLVEENEL